jgi:hypothetical protein
MPTPPTTHRPSRAARPAAAPPPADPPTPAGSATLAALQAASRAPVEQAEADAEAVRAPLRKLYAELALPALTWLRQYRTDHAAHLDALAALDFLALGAALRPGSVLARDLQRKVDEARLCYDLKAVDGTASVLDQLERLPGRIARLAATDAHACPGPPTGCGCRRGEIVAAILDAPAWPKYFSRVRAEVADREARLAVAMGVEQSNWPAARPPNIPTPEPRRAVVPPKVVL